MLIFIFGIFFDYMNRRGKYMSIDKQGSGTAPLVSVYCMTYNQEKTCARFRGNKTEKRRLDG